MTDFLLYMDGLTVGDSLGLGTSFAAVLFGLFCKPFLFLFESPIYLLLALKGELPKALVSSEYLELKLMLYSMFWSGLVWFSLSYLVKVTVPYSRSSFITRATLNYSVAGMFLLCFLSKSKEALIGKVSLFNGMPLPEPPHFSYILLWFLIAGFMSWGRAYVVYNGELPFRKRT